MGISVETLAVAKKYTNRSIEGITGSLAGKNATIDSITDITGGHRVTFKWTADNGDARTQPMDVMDGSKGDKGETGDAGLGIKAVNINAQNHLIITYDNDSTYDAGELPGGSGEVISVNGKKGAVTLDANDVGALPDDTELFSGDYNDLDNLPDLTNFITNTVDNLINYYKKTETYTKTEVDNIANTIKNGRFEVVATLPTTDIKTNVIYLVPKSTAQASNIKDEYINLDGTSAGWEKIGDTEIDLSGYVTTTALNTALAAYTTTTDLTALLADKVDKVTGKGLSTNDYANTDKELVDSIPTLAPISLVKDAVGWTGKNLLKNKASTLTTNGITWTVNDDGTVLINGTNTDNSYLTVNDDISLDVDTEYILSGNTTENADEWYLSLFLQVGYEGMTNYQYIFNNNPTGVKFKLRDLIGESNLTSLRCYMRVGFRHGAQTVDNVTFYPMVRYAAISDSTYEPYHESVETMYEEEIHGVNLLKPFIDSQTINGITITRNTDGSVGLNGTATASININVKNATSLVPESGQYILSDGVKHPNIFFYINDYSTGSWVDVVRSNYNDTSFYYDVDRVVDSRVGLYVPSGTTVSNVIFRPMLRKATIEDPTYRPYNEQAIQNQLNAQGVLGAKNLLPNRMRNGTDNGITFSVNADGSFSMNGTVPSSSDVSGYYICNDFKLSNGNYIFSTHETSDGNNIHYFIAKLLNGSYVSSLVEIQYNDNVPFTIKYDGTYDSIRVAVWIRRGTTINNKTAYPMIRLASDPDDTYQPYVMTNRELTKTVNALPREVFVTTDTRTTTTNDANTLPCGFTRMSDANSNLPTDGTGGNVWYDILTVRQSNDSSKATWGYGFQLAVQTTTNANMGDMYVRAVNGGETPTWSEWKKLN